MAKKCGTRSGSQVAGDEAVASALLEAEENLAALRTWVAAAPNDAADGLLAELRAYEDTVVDVLAMVAEARPVAADRAQAERLTPRFAEVMDDLGPPVHRAPAAGQ